MMFGNYNTKGESKSREQGGSEKRMRDFRVFILFYFIFNFYLNFSLIQSRYQPELAGMA